MEQDKRHVRLKHGYEKKLETTLHFKTLEIKILYYKEIQCKPLNWIGYLSGIHNSNNRIFDNMAWREFHRPTDCSNRIRVYQFELSVLLNGSRYIFVSIYRLCTIVVPS